LYVCLVPALQYFPYLRFYETIYETYEHSKDKNRNIRKYMALDLKKKLFVYKF